MPTYSTLCACGTLGTIYRRVAERDNLDPCHCGRVPQRILDKPMVALFPQYSSPLDGRPITSRRERDADLRKAKAYEWEPGIEKDIARKKEYEKAEAFKPLAAEVDNIVRDLNNAGKLENLNAP
jgi:hypothetical protein